MKGILEKIIDMTYRAESFLFDYSALAFDTYAGSIALKYKAERISRMPIRKLMTQGIEEILSAKEEAKSIFNNYFTKTRSLVDRLMNGEKKKESAKHNYSFEIKEAYKSNIEYAKENYSSNISGLAEILSGSINGKRKAWKWNDRERQLNDYLDNTRLGKEDYEGLLYLKESICANKYLSNKHSETARKITSRIDETLRRIER